MQCRVSGRFARVCICILDGGHFPFLDAVADPRSIGLALRATSHIRLSTLIGGEGPSSLHTTLEGPTEYVNARWM
jgi:hypothetical protein